MMVAEEIFRSGSVSAAGYRKGVVTLRLAAWCMSTKQKMKNEDLFCRESKKLGLCPDAPYMTLGNSLSYDEMQHFLSLL